MSKAEKIRALERAFAEGRIGRREFLLQAAALGGAAALSSTLPGTARAATPKKGGHMKVAIGHGSTSDSLDPGTFSDSYMISVGFALHGYLTEVAPGPELVPSVAESWEGSDGARKWTFKLRKDIEFHDGKSLTAEDVVASFNHHRGEDSKSAAKGVVDPIEDIKADGKHTVVFTLREGNADFPFIASDYHIPILPSKDGKALWQDGIGAGGYALEAYEPGVRTAVKKHPNYWKEGRAHVDSGEILSIVDPVARTNALTTGEVHLIDRVELKTVDLLARRDEIRVDETSGNQHYLFTMRVDRAPFDNVDVRLAVKHAIKREEVLDKILRGHGYVGNDHPLGRANRFLDTSIAHRMYDPDRVKHHLNKAGLSSLNVDLSASDAAFPGAVDAAVLFKEHAAPTGINVNVVREPSDGYWSNVWTVKPFCAVYWSGRPTADWMFSIAYAADASWNASYWKNERFNELLKLARAELNEQRRAEMYSEMQRLVRDDDGRLIPMFANFVFARHESLQHKDEMSADWDVDGLKFMERWWFA